MNSSLSPETLDVENRRYRGSGGVSHENRDFGFQPAFLDSQTGAVYLSRFADGRPAPFHLLDGLPHELILARHPNGRVAHIKDSVVSGFLRAGRFFNRDEAAAALALH